MARKLTQEEFIARARRVHGDKYDYSKVKYVNKEEKVCIICPVHGEFWQIAASHMRGNQCPKCYYESKMSNTEEFIKKARKIWGDRFDYSLSQYKDSKSLITINCPKHGTWQSTPNRHLRGGGCPRCKAVSHRSVVYGVGVVITDDYVCNEPSYKVWRDMLRRCYTDEIGGYKGCSVCDEWHIYDNFRDWFMPRYKNGWELDKDWISPNNRVYSPQTCFVLPKELNLLIVNRKGRQNGLPVGVYYDKRSNRFYPILSVNRKNIIHEGGFDTADEAFEVYSKYKTQHILKSLERYKNELDPLVYETLKKYKVTK